VAFVDQRQCRELCVGGSDVAARAFQMLCVEHVDDLHMAWQKPFK